MCEDSRSSKLVMILQAYKKQWFYLRDILCFGWFIVSLN
jgi:hypothetical protein